MKPDINLKGIDLPAACRKYCELSPDIHAYRSLDMWLESHGCTLDSYRQWLNWRLYVDVIDVPEYDNDSTDISFLDQLTWMDIDFDFDNGDLSFLEDI